MKKSAMKAWAIFLVLILVLSVLPMAAFAAASNTFFTRSSSGYTCTGRGSISGNTAVSTLSATANLMEPIIPGVDCVADTWVAAYDSTGAYVGSEHIYGTTYANATFVSPRSISKIGCGYTFNSDYLGYFTLKNNLS